MATKGTKKKRAGRPSLAVGFKGPSPTVTIRVTAELLARVDKYRKAQDDEPQRSDAMRSLIERGLAAEKF